MVDIKGRGINGRVKEYRDQDGDWWYGEIASSEDGKRIRSANVIRLTKDRHTFKGLTKATCQYIPIYNQGKTYLYHLNISFCLEFPESKQKDIPCRPDMLLNDAVDQRWPTVWCFEYSLIELGVDTEMASSRFSAIFLAAGSLVSHGQFRYLALGTT